MYNKNEDERITAAKYKYGYEAFQIVFSLFMIDLFIKSILLNRPIMEWLDILIIIFIGGIYSLIKSYRAGILAVLNDKKDLKIIKIKLLKTSSLAAFIFTLINIMADYISKNTILIIENLIGGMVFLISFYLIFYFVIKKSDQKANEMIEDE